MPVRRSLSAATAVLVAWVVLPLTAAEAWINRPQHVLLPEKGQQSLNPSVSTRLIRSASLDRRWHGRLSSRPLSMPLGALGGRDITAPLRNPP
jgi:hypothetical protein